MGCHMMQGNHFSKLSAFVAVASIVILQGRSTGGSLPSTLTRQSRALRRLGHFAPSIGQRRVVLDRGRRANLLHHMQHPSWAAINDALRTR